MWYKNAGKTFFRFVTNHTFDRRTDRQTEFSSLDRVCIPCSTVKTTETAALGFFYSPINNVKIPIAAYCPLHTIATGPDKGSVNLLQRWPHMIPESACDGQTPNLHDLNHNFIMSTNGKYLIGPIQYVNYQCSS